MGFNFYVFHKRTLMVLIIREVSDDFKESSKPLNSMVTSFWACSLVFIVFLLNTVLPQLQWFASESHVRFISQLKKRLPSEYHLFTSAVAELNVSPLPLHIHSAPRSTWPSLLEVNLAVHTPGLLCLLTSKGVYPLGGINRWVEDGGRTTLGIHTILTPNSSLVTHSVTMGWLHLCWKI